MPYMMKPQSNTNRQPEENYSFCHIQIRSAIERSFEVLKRRLLVLFDEIDLQKRDLDNNGLFFLHNSTRTNGDINFKIGPNEYILRKEGSSLDGIDGPISNRCFSFVKNVFG